MSWWPDLVHSEQVVAKLRSVKVMCHAPLSYFSSCKSRLIPPVQSSLNPNILEYIMFRRKTLDIGSSPDLNRQKSIEMEVALCKHSHPIDWSQLSVTHKSSVITFLNGPFLQIERKICDMNFFLSIVSIELRTIGESCVYSLKHYSVV